MITQKILITLAKKLIQKTSPAPHNLNNSPIPLQQNPYWKHHRLRRFLRLRPLRPSLTLQRNPPSKLEAWQTPPLGTQSLPPLPHSRRRPIRSLLSPKLHLRFSAKLLSLKPKHHLRLHLGRNIHVHLRPLTKT